MHSEFLARADSERRLRLRGRRVPPEHWRRSIAIEHDFEAQSGEHLAWERRYIYDARIA